MIVALVDDLRQENVGGAMQAGVNTILEKPLKIGRLKQLLDFAHGTINKNDLEDLCFQVIFVTHSLWLNHQSFFCLDCQIVLFAPVCFGTEAYRFLLYSTPGYVFRQEQ